MMRAAANASPFSAAADGIRVAIKVTPKAASDGVRGITVEADGRAYLAVRVTAAAEGGRANAALVKLLARRWRLPAGTIRLLSGATGRHKVLHVAGAPATLLDQLRSREGLTPPDPAG